MKYRLEIVNGIEELPVKLFIENIEKMQYRCDSQISLIFVIKGGLFIKQDKYHYTLTEEDIFLINPNTLHTIEGSSTNQICVLQIDGEYFNNSYTNFSKLIFKLNSSDNEEFKSEDYKYMKNILVKLLDSVTKKRNGYLLILKQLILELILCLINKFTDDVSKKDFTVNHDDERINSIIEFILTHYKEKISLRDIAEYLHLNPQYVSRYFSKQMGIPLNVFISNIRLQESLKTLSNSDKKVTYIALEYGFPNIKSYFKAFKDTYNMTPSKYRSIYVNEIKKNTIDLDFSKFNLNELTNYANNEQRLLPQIKRNHIIDCNVCEEPLNKTWKKIVGFGRAAEAMREELRNQLRMLQRDVSFEYVRFHGILSDEMMVYNEDSMGNAEYNFTYVDELIDFLLEIKLKPIIELGFMPEQLASEKKYIFLWKANISFPKSMRKWTDLIESLVIHLIERYGINEVQTWYFQVWDQLSLGNPQKNAYFIFLKGTCNAIKKVDSKLKVGGTIDLMELESYISYAKVENLALDFISLIAYAIVPIGGVDPLSLFDKFAKTSENQYMLQNAIKFCYYAHEDFISEKIDRFIQTLDKHQCLVKEIFINEWNTSPSPKDLLHDTCFKAAFLVKNILKNFHKINGMAYWSFSDIFEEMKINNSNFHGGLGLITNSGIKKPIYYAYQLMNKLGNSIIKRGEDFIVTKKQNGSLQILTFNYCHFTDACTKCDTADITLKDRYNIFDEKIKNIRFTLKGLSGEVIEKIYRINKENGSAFDEWLQIGTPSSMSSDDINYIKSKSIFGYKMKKIHVDGDFIIDEKMQPHEVLLIELLPV